MKEEIKIAFARPGSGMSFAAKLEMITASSIPSVIITDPKAEYRKTRRGFYGKKNYFHSNTRRRHKN